KEQTHGVSPNMFARMLGREGTPGQCGMRVPQDGPNRSTIYSADGELGAERLWAPLRFGEEESHALSRLRRPARLGSDLAAAEGSVSVQGILLARRGIRMGAPCQRQRPCDVADRRR